MTFRLKSRELTGILILCAAVLSGWAGITAGAESQAVTLQIRPDGLSIEAARDSIRQHRAEGKWIDRPVNVEIAEGTYFLSAPLSFGPQDGGSVESPVTYMAARGARPTISGGVKITGFEPAQINSKDVWVTQIDDVKKGKWYFRQLFVNGQRRGRTRLPAGDYYRFAGLPEMTDKTPWGEGQTKAAFKPGDLKNWTNLKDVEIVALQLWIQSRLPIASVDESTNIVNFTRPSTFRLTDGFNDKAFARYYVENVAEALDEPGQWYLDRPTGKLYYMPMPGETPENVTVIAPKLPLLLHVAGDKDKPAVGLNFVGLDFRHTDWALPDDDAGSVQASFEVPGAIVFERAENCSIRDSFVSNIANYAIELKAGCENNRIINNELTDLGAGGVKLGHDSNRTVVSNNEIGPGGRIFHSAVGVWIGNSGHNEVTHNNIHDLYYTGVSVGWSWGYNPSKAVANIVEYNHIHHLGAGMLSDMGGIYTLGVSPGTRLRYNLIHDVDAYVYGGWGLYNDEGSTGILLENNIVYRTRHSGYHQHYGKENIIRNNIFAFGKEAQIKRSREEEHLSFTYERNIVYFTEGRLFDGNWTNGHYKLDNNVYFRNPLTDDDVKQFKAWQEKGNDTNSVMADPLLVDPENNDFTVKPDSPAIKLGFKPIDTSKIGRQPREPGDQPPG